MYVVVGVVVVGAGKSLRTQRKPTSVLDLSGSHESWKAMEAAEALQV